MATNGLGWKFSMATVLALLCVPKAAWAGSSDEPVTGPLIKAELNVAGPGFAMQTTAFDDITGGPEEFSFADPMMVVGPVLGLNLGFAPSPTFRLGLRGTASGLAVLAGGNGSIPHTSFDAQMRLTVGPTFGWRFGPASPVELELGLGFAGQMMAGGQVSIGSPDNGYPLGATQYGADVVGRVIWRPWGARSVVGFNFGVDVGWAMVPGGDTSTHGILVTPEAGIVVGL